MPAAAHCTPPNRMSNCRYLITHCRNPRAHVSRENPDRVSPDARPGASAPYWSHWNFSTGTSRCAKAPRSLHLVPPPARAPPSAFALRLACHRSCCSNAAGQERGSRGCCWLRPQLWRRAARSGGGRGSRGRASPPALLTQGGCSSLIERHAKCLTAAWTVGAMRPSRPAAAKAAPVSQGACMPSKAPFQRSTLTLLPPLPCLQTTCSQEATGGRGGTSSPWTQSRPGVRLTCLWSAVTSLPSVLLFGVFV